LRLTPATVVYIEAINQARPCLGKIIVAFKNRSFLVSFRTSLILLLDDAEIKGIVIPEREELDSFKTNGCERLRDKLLKAKI
jgi:hypothetical protein